MRHADPPTPTTSLSPVGWSHRYDSAGWDHARPERRDLLVALVLADAALAAAARPRIRAGRVSTSAWGATAALAAAARLRIRAGPTALAATAALAAAARPRISAGRVSTSALGATAALAAAARPRISAGRVSTSALGAIPPRRPAPAACLERARHARGRQAHQCGHLREAWHGLCPQALLESTSLPLCCRGARPELLLAHRRYSHPWLRSSFASGLRFISSFFASGLRFSHP